MTYPTYKKIKTKPYTVWESIKSRCTSVTSYNYCRYGAKGVLLCDEWDDDFQAFASWYVNQCEVLGLDPENHNYQVDKDILCLELGIDPPIYSPTTCKLVSPKENNPTNVRTRVISIITPDGDTIDITNIKDFCALNNLNYSSFKNLTSGRSKNYKGYSLSTPNP